MIDEFPDKTLIINMPFNSAPITLSQLDQYILHIIFYIYIFNALIFGVFLFIKTLSNISTNNSNNDNVDN